METTATQPVKAFDYRSAANSVLKQLKRDRDRHILAKRYGFEQGKRQTLEEIGRGFSITRERVRQIEKAAITKIRQLDLPEVASASQLLGRFLEQQGGIISISEASLQMGATTPSEQQAIIFMATLSNDINVIDEDDTVRQALALSDYDSAKVHELARRLTKAVGEQGEPATIAKVISRLESEISVVTAAHVAEITKQLAELDGKWGLASWPSVNPKSIRDKTYIVLTKHNKPLHFTEISKHIADSSFTRRNVTVQAVHNELIKDPRFVLIGRGIYALAEWGYTPGTVADIISEVLREESPLHKDEIIKRVLQKRQVRTTTIILNLQEKDSFVRVAKATYKLKED